MSSSQQQPASPIAVFADLETDVWGLLVGGDEPAVAAARMTDAAATLRPAALDLSDPAAWMLTADGCALHLEPLTATTTTHEARRVPQPCRVSGSLTLNGLERRIDVGGARSEDLDLAGPDQVRVFASFFPAGHEIALMAKRPRDSRGHDRELIGVSARGEEHPLVLDPRLSTTYGASGTPRRVGLELWLADDVDGDQFPRRVAGEALGSQLDAGRLSAHAFRCTSRGEAGAGVYVLTRPS